MKGLAYVLLASLVMGMVLLGMASCNTEKEEPYVAKQLDNQVDYYKTFYVADTYGFKYARFKKPVTLENGKRYYVISEEHVDGDLFCYKNSLLYLDGFEVSGIVRRENLTSSKSCNGAFVGINLLLK